MTNAPTSVQVRKSRAVRIVEVVHQGNDLWDRIQDSEGGPLRRGHLVRVRSVAPLTEGSGLVQTVLEVDESVVDSFLEAVGASRTEAVGRKGERDWGDYEGAMSDCDEAVRQMIRLLNGKATREGTRKWICLNYPKLANDLLDSSALSDA